MTGDQERLQRLHETLHLLTDARKLIVRATNEQQLMNDFCQLLVRQRGYALAWIGLAREGDWVVQPVARAGLESAYLDSIKVTWDESPSGLGVTGTALRRNAPEISQDAMVDERLRAWLPYLEEHSLRSLASMPMRLGENAVGALTVYSNAVGVFDTDEIELLQSVADDLAHGLRRLQIEQQREQRVRQVEAIRELTADMITDASFSRLAHQILIKAIDLIGGGSGGAYLTDPAARVVRCIFSHQTARDYAGNVLRYGEGAAGLVAETKQGMIIPDYHTWEGRAEGFDQDASAFQALLVAPMVWRGEVVGVIDVMRPPGALPFAPTDLDLLQLFANQAAVALQNARLLSDAQDRLAQLGMMHDITRAALGESDPHSLVELLCERLNPLVHAADCRVMLWERGREGAPALVSGRTGPGQLEALHHGAAQALAELVLQMGEPAVSQDAGSLKGLPRKISRALAGYPLMVLPLEAGDEKLGVMFVLGEKDHPLPAGEQRFVSQTASLISLVLDHKRAFEAVQRHSQGLEGLRQASLQLTSILDVHRLLDVVLEHALRIVPADDAHIFLYDGHRLSLGAARWQDQAQPQPRSFPRDDGITATVARTGKPLVIPNTAQNPLTRGLAWEGAIAALPLCVGGNVLGVMNVAHLRPYVFRPNELELLELLADQAAAAVQNASLFQRADADRRREQLLHDLARQLSASLDPADVLQTAIRLAAESLGCRSGNAFLYAADEDRLILLAAHRHDGLTASALNERLSLHRGKGLEGWVAAHASMAVVDDLQSDERWLKLPGLEEEGRSAISVPILAGQVLLGVLTLVGEHAFSPEDQRLLERISGQVSLALQNAIRHRETEHRLAEMTAVQQVAQVVNRRLELTPLMDEVVNQVADVLGYANVEIMLVEGNTLVMQVSRGSGWPVGKRVPISEGIVGRVTRTGIAAYVPDVTQDPDYIAAVPDTLSEIVVPLRKSGVVIGVLNVESPVRYGLGRDDLELLELLADQMTVAIENAALYDRLHAYTTQLEAMVAERTEKLAQALRLAQQADQLKTQFVADVSHELRTPLTNIRLYLELLTRASVERVPEYLDTLNRETERLVVLIEDLLAISRLDTGAVAIKHEPVDLNEIARRLVEDRRRLLAERLLDLDFTPAPNLPTVLGDEHMLTQVVANLVTNAMNYTVANSTIHIATALQTWESLLWVTLAVVDSGPGVPPEEQSLVFERFYRGSASRRAGTPGTGLGLAICKEVLQRHAGRITLESQIGEGAAFTIWLPVDSLDLSRRPAEADESHADAQPGPLPV
jgi:GAF domain-containing protein